MNRHGDGGEIFGNEWLNTQKQRTVDQLVVVRLCICKTLADFHTKQNMHEIRKPKSSDSEFKAGR